MTQALALGPGPGTLYELEVRPVIPERLTRLGELADDLYYSWAIEVRQLFLALDRDLWMRCGHNPKLFLRRVSQERLDAAARDPIFLEAYNGALSTYDTYLREREPDEAARMLAPGSDLVAYFCAEFGFHESLPIYSGGLGILAGDHCKAASDLNIPFVAVGLLYRQGYFTQTIDGYGNQIAHFAPSDFSVLPLTAARDAAGAEIHVEVEIDARTVHAKVWRAKIGHVSLYLLDSDVPGNGAGERAITQQLYVGDHAMRLQQEMLLGIGGVRALRALGLAPSVWHINEGHPAFLVLERAREKVAAGHGFDAALELVAANTVFTTHTPVPAGHDIFDHGLMQRYFARFAESLQISMEHLLELGASPAAQGGFNMTSLAVRGARFHNGVSRIHGAVSARLLGYAWPQIPHEENPAGYVTNGVHVQTFLAKAWRSLFDVSFGAEWRKQLTNVDYWRVIDTIPDYQYWSTHQALKADLLKDVHRRVLRQYLRNGYSEVEIARVTRLLSAPSNDLLIIGFARRFATYKRATLILSDVARLARLLGDAKRPVLILFAGKAHPSDMPGQHLIHTIHSLSRRPEFEGRLILLEGYDLALARRLVAGVDVWLNTPEYPLEASGTSGQKAGMNGALNLSVLDGWWGEGYNGDNGWAIPPHHSVYTNVAERDRIEAQELLDLLEFQVLPLYYERNAHGYSEQWVRKSKASMRSILPRFSAQRMVLDYVRDYYAPAQQYRRRLADHEARAAAWLAAWKKRVASAWPRVQARRLDSPPHEIAARQSLHVQVAVRLDELDFKDVRVECLFGTRDENTVFHAQRRHALTALGLNEQGEAVYALKIAPGFSGLQYYKIRVYPYHPLLRHPLEVGLMLWI